MTETHPQNRRLGYARVSTYGQTLDAQLEQLRGAGCIKIFREKVTGAHSDRRQLLKMLDTLALSIVRERYSDFGPTPAFAAAGSWRRRSWQSITAARCPARPFAAG